MVLRSVVRQLAGPLSVGHQSAAPPSVGHQSAGLPSVVLRSVGHPLAVRMWVALRSPKDSREAYSLADVAWAER